MSRLLRALQKFRESLLRSLKDADDDRDQYLGMSLHLNAFDGRMFMAAGLSLRELVHDYKHQTLVLFKCCLLQPKVQSRIQPFDLPRLTMSDAVLRVPLRTVMHDAVCFDLFDPGPVAQPGGLRRS